MLLLCFIISALFIYISFHFQNIFHIFPNMYFPISTNIYFPISLKTNPLSSLMYPLFCFFVISQVKKTTTKIQGALDEDQESQVINTFSIHIITVYFRSAVCLLPVKPEVHQLTRSHKYIVTFVHFIEKLSLLYVVVFLSAKFRHIIFSANIGTLLSSIIFRFHMFLFIFS